MVLVSPSEKLSSGDVGWYVDWMEFAVETMTSTVFHARLNPMAMWQGLPSRPLTPQPIVESPAGSLTAALQEMAKSLERHGPSPRLLGPPCALPLVVSFFEDG